MNRFDVTNRIKNYRNLLNITQNQLANDKLSLSLIKSIEAGRRKLTPLKANIMVENFKKIALSKGISLTIDVSEFLMSDKDYARHYCIKKLDILCNSYDEQEYEDLLNIANEYGLEDIKLCIYTKYGDYFFGIQNYNISLRFLHNAYDASIVIKDNSTSLKLLTKIGVCYFFINDLENSIKFYTKCYNELIDKNIHDNPIKFSLFYNIAAYYKKTNNYTLALEWLEKSISLDDVEKSKVNHAILLKANILTCMGNYTEALNIYEYLLEHDTKFIHIIYNNMAYAYDKLKDQEKSIEYLNQSINMQIENNEATITLSLLNLGEIYNEKNKYMESIIFYQYALDSCIKNKQPEYIYTCCNTLLNLYKLVNKSDRFYQHVISLIKIYLQNPELREKFSCFFI